MASFNFNVLELLEIIPRELSLLLFEISKCVPSFFGYNLGSFSFFLREIPKIKRHYLFTLMISLRLNQTKQALHGLNNNSYTLQKKTKK